ncbi:MAG: alpha/beta hydrolase [Clostridia bacterium]|nr:alpha/beta hydrolase [Clostridia bacterium]
MAYFDFEGKKVYYEIHGEVGEPLVILNGIMMSTNSWKPFINDFSKNNVTILVDFLDQGRSERMTESYNHDIQVRLLNSLFDQLPYQKYAIMGISYGGEVAIQYAVKHPQRVRRLILANTCARTSDWLRKIGDGWNEVAKTYNGLAYYLTTIPVIYSTGFYEKQSAWMQNREGTLTEYFSNPQVLEALIRLTDSSRDYDYTDRLGEITCPTLIISGSEDGLVPPTEQVILHQGIKGSVYVTINGSGHASMYEDPASFCALVLGFANLSDKPIKI